MQFSNRFVIRNPAGFTLLELLFVIALAGIFVASAFPLGQRYLERGKLDEAARDFASSARYAQLQSQAGQFDAAWGVKVDPGAITLFQGATYATRAAAYDQTVAIPSSFVITGTSEFGFAKRTGRTTAGTVTITDSSGLSKAVAINGFGTVDF